MDGIREVFVLVVLGWNSYTDIRERKISLVSVAILGAAGVGLAVTEWVSPWRLVVGLLPGMVMMGIRWLTGGALGMGDGILMLGIGSCLSVEKTVGTLFAGLFLAALGAGIDLFFVRRQKNAQFPLVPFLLIGNMGRLCL